MERATVLIVGGSLSGLALAACLHKRGIGYRLLEKEDCIAPNWRRHYKRLHLHTPKEISQLPYKKFDRAVSRYPSREEVLRYVDEYSAEHHIEPLFQTEVTGVERKGNLWRLQTTTGDFQSKYIVLATGLYSKPIVPHIDGINTFPGVVIHSSKYRSGSDFKGKNILVVGFGNSACEIAMDLFEQGAFSSLSVRSAVNIVPRDLFGIPILYLSLWLAKLPPLVADALIAPVLWLLYRDLKTLGLKKQKYGVFRQIRKEQTSPVLDIGVMKYIRQKHIRVWGKISHIGKGTVCFEDGRKQSFDAIVFATGYGSGETDLIKIDKSFEKHPALPQKSFVENGLYVCGFRLTPTGFIRQIAKEAKRIADDISRRELLR